MNIAVIGMGGVGGYFGGKLSRVLESQSDVNLYYVARNQHLKEIQENGLLLETVDGSMLCRPTAALETIGELPSLDLCIVCVKGYDLQIILKELSPKIGPKTIILPLLNGVDIYERIRSVIKRGIVLPSCVYVGTHLEKPGMVVQTGGACTILFGPDPANKVKPERLLELLDLAEIKYSWLDNPYPEIWSKFIFIAAYGLVTAYYDKTIGEVMESESLTIELKNIMVEIKQIALAKFIELPESIVDDSYNKGGNFPFFTKTSFQRDYENKEKKDERDLFGGTVIRMGSSLGIPTTTTSRIYRLIEEGKSL